MAENTNLETKVVSVGSAAEPPPLAGGEATNSPPLAESSAAPAEGEGGDSGGPPVPPPPKEDFYKTSLQKRVDKLTAQKRALEAQLVAAQAGGKPSSPKDEEAIQRLVDERAEARAEALVAKRTFDQQTNAVYDEGVASFGKAAFDDKIERLKSIRDDSDDKEMARYTQFVGALLKTGEAARLIHSLADDLSEASRLMNLPPFELGMELARLSAKAPPAEGSRVPKPILPIGSHGRSHAPLKVDSAEGDRLDTATWMKRRIEQADQKNKELGRRVL